MTRLELTGIRVCHRCGRGRAMLTSENGARLSVPLDPARAQELSRGRASDGVRTLSALVLEQLAASDAAVHEVVLDAREGALHALLSFSRGSDADVVSCTPQEGLALAVRGGLALYATDEALDHAAAARPAPSGSETVH